MWGMAIEPGHERPTGDDGELVLYLKTIPTLILYEGNKKGENRRHHFRFSLEGGQVRYL